MPRMERRTFAGGTAAQIRDFVAGCRDAAHVRIERCAELPPEDYAVLGELARVEHLELGRCAQLTDEALAPFSRLSALRELVLDGAVKLRGPGLAHLPDRPLRRLQLDALWELQGPELARLPRSLRSLRLLECYRVSDTGLMHLAECADLEDLSLVFCPVHDAGIAWLASLRRLSTLYLLARDITDRSMGHLAELPSLARLTLYNCDAISDAGMELLARSRSLREVEVAYCKVTEDGLEKLWAIPGLRRAEFIE
jgi:hypothetical protein